MTSRASPDAGRVGHHQPGRRAGPPRPQHRRHVAPVHPGPGPFAQVVPGVADRGRVRLDADHRPARPDRRGQRSGEQPGPAVQVERHVTRPRLEPGQDSVGQHVGRGRDAPARTRPR